MYKLDDNHNEIVQAFRDAGCPVAEIARSKSDIAGLPDIAVGVYNRRLDLVLTVWVEIKAPKGKLSSYQLDFRRDWDGSPYAVVRNIDDVVAVIETWQRLNVV